MDAGLLTAFWGVSLLFVLTPGADWAYAIASGVTHRSGVAPAVLGMLTGHVVATLIVVAGVVAVIVSSDLAMTTLTVAGGGYLLWLGVGVLRHPPTPDLTGTVAPASRRVRFGQGVGVSLLNPKVFLLFLALLPQFTSAAAPWHLSLQMAMLGAIHVLNCAVVYFAVGFSSATVLGRRPRAAQIVGRVSGVVMIVLGIALIVEKLVAVAF